MFKFYYIWMRFFSSRNWSTVKFGSTQLQQLQLDFATRRIRQSKKIEEIAVDRKFDCQHR